MDQKYGPTWPPLTANKAERRCVWGGAGVHRASDERKLPLPEGLMDLVLTFTSTDTALMPDVLVSSGCCNKYTPDRVA